MSENIVYRALKVKLYPDEEQKRFLDESFGCFRFYYNYLLDERLNFYNNTIKLIQDKNIRKLKWLEFKPTPRKVLKEKFDFLNKCSDDCLSAAERNLKTAFQTFIKSIKGLRKGKPIGLPKFKSKKKHKDFYKESHLRKDVFDFHNRRISILKCPSIKFAHSDKLPRWFNKETCALKSITISRDSCNDYFASLLFELENFDQNQKPINESQVIGLDFSPKNLYIDSNGESAKKFGYKPFKQIHLKKLSHLQRLLENKVKGSKNWERARVKVAKLERHIAFHRYDFREKHTRELVERYSLIGIEDLDLIKISRALINAKNMEDTSWGIFTTRLEQKGREFGCGVIRADRFYASSKLCSVCGYKLKTISLNTRKWTCPKCHTHHDRDMNAAINLKQNALRKEIDVPLKQGKLMSVENL